MLAIIYELPIPKLGFRGLKPRGLVKGVLGGGDSSNHVMNIFKTVMDR